MLIAGGLEICTSIMYILSCIWFNLIFDLDLFQLLIVINLQKGLVCAYIHIYIAHIYWCTYATGGRCS